MNETVLQMIKEIFEVCIIPLLGVLTTYLIKYISAKKEEIIAKIDDETTKKYISMLSDTVTDCVIATNQTYVDSLKKDGKFDAEAQKKAFEMTRDAVLAIVTEDMESYLTDAVGDLNLYIEKMIEAQVNKNK